VEVLDFDIISFYSHSTQEIKQLLKACQV